MLLDKQIFPAFNSTRSCRVPPPLAQASQAQGGLSAKHREQIQGAG